MASGLKLSLKVSCLPVSARRHQLTIVDARIRNKQVPICGRYSLTLYRKLLATYNQITCHGGGVVDYVMYISRMRTQRSVWSAWVHVVANSHQFDPTHLVYY